MKIRYVWAFLLALSLFSCDDSTNSLGLDIFPKEDQIKVTLKNYQGYSRSVRADSIYAKTDIVYVGKYTDDKFGDYEASFLTQLNCLDSLTFPKVYDPNITEIDKGIMAGDSTYLSEIIFIYDTLLGDSISPSNITLYPLNKNLRTNHYTDIDAEEFYDPNGKYLSEATYSGVNLNTDDTSTSKQKFIRFKLDKEVGENILHLNRNHPEYFYNNKVFRDNVFKGFYAKNTAGKGSVLFVKSAYLSIVYNVHYIDSLGNKLLKQDKTDSIYQQSRVFASTREIVQANKLLTDASVLDQRIAEKQHTYIKAPAGIFTEIALPVDNLLADDEIKNDSITSVKIVLQSFVNEQGNSSFKLERPQYLAMLRKSEYKTFFQENKMFDYKTSFYATLYNTGKYTFNRIEKLIIKLKEEKAKAEKEAKEKAGSNWNQKEWEEQWLADNPDWNKVLIVPVNIDATTDSYGNTTMRGVTNNLMPQAVRLEGGYIEENGKPIDMSIIFTSYDDKNMGL